MSKKNKKSSGKKNAPKKAAKKPVTKQKSKSSVKKKATPAKKTKPVAKKKTTPTPAKKKAIAKKAPAKKIAKVKPAPKKAEKKALKPAKPIVAAAPKKVVAPKPEKIKVEKAPKVKAEPKPKKEKAAEAAPAEKPLSKKELKAAAKAQEAAKTKALENIKKRLHKAASEEEDVRPTNEPPGKFELEYVVHSSAELLFTFLTEPSGLSEWFCDDVNIRHGIYTFIWDGSEQQAKEMKIIPERLARFQWIDKTDGSYFEFRIEKDDLTSDISLIITDFAETEEERNSSKLLWDSQIDKLLHVMGAYF